MSKPRCVWEAGANLGEGPVWLPEEGALYWVDIEAPAVHRYVPQSAERTSWPMRRRVSCIVPRRPGGFLAASEHGIGILDLDGGTVETLIEPEADRATNRFNDGKCDTAGRFWTGSMDDELEAATGALYRFDPDGKLSREDEGYICTNGPALSPDGAVLYHTDTLDRTIYAFDLAENGRLSNKRPFIQIAEYAGYPDGMTVDEEGCIWVAHYQGSRITRFTPGGDIEREIRFPVVDVTSCAFGGPDLRTLYATTSSKDLSPAEKKAHPLAGGLFEIDLEVRGLPVARFGG